MATKSKGREGWKYNTDLALADEGYLLLLLLTTR